MDPTELDETLKFDTNELPLIDSLERSSDLNFSPNVVFSLDSTRAFVSYPGSNKVVAFDGFTGEVLALIEVGTNPVQLTLTPDGRKVGVVSLFLKDNLPQPGGAFQGKLVGSISLIDVESLQATTLELSSVFFSFANNIVFSADSMTGFVASAGTDEIVRFDVETLSEIGPRLRMTAGTRPSSITMAPDRSFFAVVLVGSSFLDRRAVPDSVQIIDADTFTIRHSISPPFDANQLPHDFVISNTVAFSPDGRFALIADQLASSRAVITALANDRAFLMDIEQGEVVHAFGLGTGAAHGAYLTPDGRFFLVVSTFELTLIDFEERQVESILPLQSNYQETSRVAFSSDGQRLFIAAPFNDRLLVIDLLTFEISKSEFIGEPVEVAEDIFITAAPLDLTLSPDGERLAVTFFNANTVELFVETERLLVPRLLSNEEWFTGIALTNNADQEAVVRALSTRPTGQRFEDDPETEEVVEFVNPKFFTLESGTQVAFTAHDLLEPAPELDIEGWLVLDSDQPQTVGFFLTGDPEQRRLDGGLASKRTSLVEIIPEVRVTDGFRTELTLLNPNFTSTTATIALFNRQGIRLGDVSQVLGARTVFTRFVRQPDLEDDSVQGLFTEDLFQDFEGGYLLIDAAFGFLSFVRYFDDDRLAALNGIRLVGRDVSLPETLYIPQVATFAGSETYLTLTFPFEEEAAVRLSLKGNDGSDLAAPVEIQIESGIAVRYAVSELFNLVNTGSPVAGWILIESDREGVVAIAEIQTFAGRAMSTIPAQAVLSKSIVFSHVAQGLGYSTGLALLNPGIEEAQVRLDVFNPEGDLVGFTDLLLPPMHRESKLLSEFVQEVPGLVGGFIRITSSQPIVGLELFFTNDLEQLSVVPGQILGD